MGSSEQLTKNPDARSALKTAALLGKRDNMKHLLRFSRVPFPFGARFVTYIDHGSTPMDTDGFVSFDAPLLPLFFLPQ